MIGPSRLHSYFFFLLAIVIATPSLVVAQGFQIEGEPQFFDESCLEGEIPEWFRYFNGPTFDDMCRPEEICDDTQRAQNAIEFQNQCQGNLILKCFSETDSNLCITALAECLTPDVQELNTALKQRISASDLSTLPKLARRRLENPNLFVAPFSCSEPATASHLRYFDNKFGVDPRVYCRTALAEEMRSKLLNLHYTLDRYGVPR